MRFTAVGFSPLPDIETARHDLGLHDLSEKDVAKVLFHRRKQAGQGEQLGWEHSLLSVVSLIRMDERDVRIETLTLAEAGESAIIKEVLRAVKAASPLVTWHPGFMPLLQFRCLKHRRSAADYWMRLEDGLSPHVDLRTAFGTDGTPSLDAMARSLRLPGMLGMQETQLWDRYLADDQLALASHADYQALNTALIGLEIFHLQGRISLNDLEARLEFLNELLNSPPLEERFRAFCTHWTPTP